MYAAVVTALQATPESLGLAALPAKRQLLVAKIAEIYELATIQNQGTRGKTARRDELLQGMVDLTLDVANALTAYAAEHQLTELRESVDVSAGTFARLRIADRPGRARVIHDTAQPVVAELVPYGVTPATLAELQAQIGLVQAWLDQPRQTIRARTEATAQLAGLFRETNELLEGQIDRLVFLARKPHPEFYAAYRRAREIIGTRGREGQPEAAAPTVASAVSAAGGSSASPLAQAA